MDRLGLLPTSNEEVEAKVAAFATLSDFVRRPLPAAVLVLMKCLAAKAATVKNAEYVLHLIMGSSIYCFLIGFYS